MLGGIILYGIVWVLSLIFPYEEERNKPKAKYRMKEVEEEGTLFFTDATDFDEAFKF